jgi:pyridoxamine 5'-phosphate oxidase
VADHPLADRPLNEADMGADPFEQFSSWFGEAAGLVGQPDAIALATAAPDGAPSVRMVLLKGWDERGFRFFTNYDSRKGAELAANPRAALVVHWEPLHRQVRAEGSVERLDDAESDLYFATRPRASQLAAFASRQSAVIPDRADLERAVRDAEALFEGRDVPRPPWWGGYVLEPRVIEFWQHRENRLHDRLAYRRSAQRWRLERLAP